MRQRKLAIGLATAVVLAVLIGLRSADLVYRRRQILTAGDRRTENLARILAGYVRQTFATGDAALRQLALHNVRVGGPSASDSEWLPALQAARVGLPSIASISVLDAYGTIQHSTQPRIVGESRRATFLFTALSADSSSRLVADAPFRTVVGDRRFVIPIGRRLASAPGTFQGVVVASYVPDSLREFFGTVDVGREGTITVFHAGGFVLFREPSAGDAIGEQAVGSPLFEAARRVGGTGFYRGRMSSDGITLRTAFRTLDQERLIIAVSRSERELLAQWNRDAATSLAGAAFAAVALTGFLLLLFRQIDVRQSAEAALVRSQRLESLGQLTGGVAHDFNNLLTVILGNVSLLRSTAATPARGGATDDSLAEIEHAAGRAADLTRRLLAFARRQPLLPRVIDLAAAVESAEPMLRRIVGDGAKLRIVRSDRACLANVDPAQIETALLNLCANARDAMPRGGTIVIETGKTVLDELYARAAGDITAGPYSSITVSDTGDGIPPEHVSRVFEPFFTTKGPGRGVGLGLSMVYGFVKQSGGHIRVYSEVGRGTTVKLYFPEVEGAPATLTPVPDDEPRGRGEVVLLVEDEPLVRVMAVRLLRRLGYNVLEAVDGRSALAQVHEDTRVDLLFTDVALPGELTGPKVAEELARRRPGLRVLYASGHSQEIVDLGARNGAAVRFLSKPYDRRTLARALRDALQG